MGLDRNVSKIIDLKGMEVYKVSDIKLKGSYTDRYDWSHLNKYPGVYLLVNTENNKVYLGGTSNILTRIPSHIKRLERGVHKKKNIQSEFSSDKFLYVVVEYTEDYENREIYWWEFFKTNAYNTRPSPETNKNVFPSKESISKMAKKVSKALKGRTPKNIELCRKNQRREILEFENGKLVNEYPSCREAGRILGVCYKRINRIVVKNSRDGFCNPLPEYPNKNWIYKDNQPVRNVIRR